MAQFHALTRSVWSGRVVGSISINDSPFGHRTPRCDAEPPFASGSCCDISAYEGALLAALSHFCSHRINQGRENMEDGRKAENCRRCCDETKKALRIRYRLPNQRNKSTRGNDEQSSPYGKTSPVTWSKLSKLLDVSRFPRTTSV